MRRRVDEVSEGDERGGQTYGRAVEGNNQDLRVIDEGVRDVEVVGNKVAHDFAADVRPIRVEKGRLNVHTTGWSVSLRVFLRTGEMYAEKKRPVPVRMVM